MSFSYALVASLFLLAPGLCIWAGIRLGQDVDVARPRPDKPNSTTTLLVVVVGSLLAHALGAGTLTLLEVFCQPELCMRTPFDPNAYRVLLTGGDIEADIPAEAIALWLGQLIGLCALVSYASEWTSKHDTMSGTFDGVVFGWLRPVVTEVRRGDAVVVAYVVTKIEQDGARVGYEGIVEQVGIDEDQAVTMITLSSVDRFLLAIAPEGTLRHDLDRAPITLLHIRADEFANVAFDVFARRSLEPADLAADDVVQSDVGPPLISGPTATE